MDKDGERVQLFAEGSEPILNVAECFGEAKGKRRKRRRRRKLRKVPKPDWVPMVSDGGAKDEASAGAVGRCSDNGRDTERDGLEREDGVS